MSDDGPVWSEPFRRQPLLAWALVACTVFGAALGGTLLSDDWSIARRILGGGLSGLGTGILIVGTKLIG